MRSSPPGVCSDTSSPSRAFSSARAIGEIQLTSPCRLSASSMPLMVMVRSLALLVGVGHGGAEEDLVAAVVHRRVGHLGDVQPLGQEADAAVDLAQPLLAVEVVAVLRAVAVLRRPGHHLDHLRPLVVQQRHQLVRAAAGSRPASCSCACPRAAPARRRRRRPRRRRVALAGEGLAHGGIVQARADARTLDGDQSAAAGRRLALLHMKCSFEACGGCHEAQHLHRLQPAHADDAGRRAAAPRHHGRGRHGLRHLRAPPGQGGARPGPPRLAGHRARPGWRAVAGHGAARRSSSARWCAAPRTATCPLPASPPDGPPCTIGTACRLHGVLDEAVQAFYRVLDRYTLADLVRNPRALSRLLFVEQGRTDEHRHPHPGAAAPPAAGCRRRVSRCGSWASGPSTCWPAALPRCRSRCGRCSTPGCWPRPTCKARCGMRTRCCSASRWR